MCRSQVSFPKPLTTSAGTISWIIFIAYVGAPERWGMWIQEVLYTMMTHELKNHFWGWMWFTLWSPGQVLFLSHLICHDLGYALVLCFGLWYFVSDSIPTLWSGAMFWAMIWVTHCLTPFQIYVSPHPHHNVKSIFKFPGPILIQSFKSWSLPYVLQN